MRRRRGLACSLTVVVAALAAACAGDSADSSPAEGRSAETTSIPAETTPAAPSGDITVEATGHLLDAECSPGPGPSVVFLHGAGGTGGDWQNTIAHLDGFSTCSYDRFNVGSSGTDSGRHSPEETAEDLEGLLEATRMEPPYILVGHSWGGLLALIEAGRHPEQVAGLVLVDATLPFETELDPPELVDEVREEMNAFEPGLDAYDGYAEARLVEGELPDVPMTYIYGVQQELPWPTKDYESALGAWVATWPHGRLVRCDCGHGIPDEEPELIGAEVRSVAAAAP